MIVTIIPYKEGYDRDNFGAISLTVAEFYERSKYKNVMKILGGKPIKNPLSKGYQVVSVKRKLFERESHAYLRSCIEVINKSRPKLIELHNRPAWINYLVKRLQIPVALYLHNDPQEMKKAKTTAQRARLLDSCVSIYCVSEYVRKRFIEGLKGHPNVGKVKVIYNFINQRQLVDFSHKQKLIMFVGRLIKEKGIIEFAQAMRKVLPANHKWKAIIIGGSKGKRYFDRCYKEVMSLLKDFPEQVIYYPKCTHEDTMSWFDQASIAVLPSVWDEPFGRTILESISCGCALITTKNGAIPEIVKDAAIFVDQITPEYLGNAVSDLIKRPSKLVSYQKKASLQASNFINNFASVKKLDDFRKEYIT